MTSDSGAEVQIWPFRACAMHPAIIIGTLRSLWTWLCGRRSQNVFLVVMNVFLVRVLVTCLVIKIGRLTYVKCDELW